MPLSLRFQSSRRRAGPPCPHDSGENLHTMGCTASKPVAEHTAVNDWYPPVAKGISMPTHARNHMQFVDDFEIVPLAGRRYGIMKVDAPKEQPKNFIHGDFMREALERLDQLDVGKDSGPKSWLESASMLEDLKPGLEKYFGEVGGLTEVTKPASENRSSSRIQSESYDAADTVFQAKGEKIRDEEASSLSERRDPNGRVNCDSYISAINTAGDRSKTSKSFRGAKSLKRLFSFGAQSKKGSSTAHNGKADGEGVAFRKDGLEDSLNSLSEPRSSLFDADFLASFEDVMKNITLGSLDSLQTTSAGAELCINTNSPKVQSPSSRSKSGNASISEADRCLKSSKAENVPAAPKRAPAAKQTVVKKPDPLEKFPKVFLPGSEKSVVLYTTSLRGVRKTFEDCNNARTVLQSFGISIDERDMSLHQDFRNELRSMMGKPVPVPQLLVKGRYIGGVEEIMQLHEDGHLGELMEGIAKDEGNGSSCDGCGGVRFVPCFDCSGSRKLVNDEDDLIRCPHCNENGLILCPLCNY